MPDTAWREQPTVFDCQGDRLIGVACVPPQPPATGVLIIVGGPQYRAGSHRQFTLLARALARDGVASFRFDYRGVGDSEGEMRDFEFIDADIRAAIDAFQRLLPQVTRIVIWGLCGAADAALYYGHTDPRVKRMILLNPWAHTESGAAQARLKHYYLERLTQKSFWLKLFSGNFRLLSSLTDLLRNRRLASATRTCAPAEAGAPVDERAYIDRMLAGMTRYTGRIRFVLSENDLTAQEFRQLVDNDRQWKRACGARNVELVQVPEANHTFSTRAWRGRVEDLTKTWIADSLKD